MINSHVYIEQELTFEIEKSKITIIASDISLPFNNSEQTIVPTVSVNGDNVSNWDDYVTHNYINSLPKDCKSGGYNFEFSIIDTNNYYLDQENSDASAQLTIEKLQVKLSISDFELNYDSTKRDYKDIFDEILSNVSCTMLDGSTIPYTFQYDIRGMHNGVYKYGVVSGVSGLIKPENDNLIGSTYIVTIDPLASYMNNFTIIDNTIIFKYKTVLIGDSYYTIEDALTKTNSTMLLIGDNTSYVMTSFTKIYGNKSHNLTGSELIVTYESSGKKYTADSSATSNVVYSALYVPSGITLNVIDGSTLVVAALIAYAQPSTTIARTRGVVMNDGTINIGSATSTGNYLYSYGYLKSSKNSNGLVRVYNGSTAIDCMHIYDWPGGNTATKIYETLLPMNAWSVHNISCDTRIDGGATYKTFFYAKATVEVKPEITIITSNSGGNCLFASLDTNSYIMKKASSAVNSPSDDNLYTIEGSNQINGQKDIIELYGNYKNSVLSIDVGVSITISTSVACPLGFANVILKSTDSINTVLTLSNADYLFLPGTSLTIENGATLNISSGVDLSFETVEHIESINDTSYAFRHYIVDKIDAKLILYGTLNCSGSIGGLIVPGKEGIELNLSSATVTTSFYSLYNAVGSSATS